MTTTSSQREFVATYYTAHACTVEVGLKLVPLAEWRAVSDRIYRDPSMASIGGFSRHREPLRRVAQGVFPDALLQAPDIGVVRERIAQRAVFQDQSYFACDCLPNRFLKSVVEDHEVGAQFERLGRLWMEPAAQSRAVCQADIDNPVAVFVPADRGNVGRASTEQLLQFRPQELIGFARPRVTRSTRKIAT